MICNKKCFLLQSILLLIPLKYSNYPKLFFSNYECMPGKKIENKLIQLNHRPPLQLIVKNKMHENENVNCLIFTLT